MHQHLTSAGLCCYCVRRTRDISYSNWGAKRWHGMGGSQPLNIISVEALLLWPLGNQGATESQFPVTFLEASEFPFILFSPVRIHIERTRKFLGTCFAAVSSGRWLTCRATISRFVFKWGQFNTTIKSDVPAVWFHVSIYI